MTNGFWAICIVGLLAFWTVVIRRVNLNASFVAVAHNAIWAGAVALIGSDLIEFKESSTTAWLILASGLSFFNLGAILATLDKAGSSKKKIVVKAEFAHGEGHLALVSRGTLLTLLVLYSGAFLYYVFALVSRFGLSVLIADPASIRGQDYLTEVPLPVRMILHLGPILLVVLGLRSAVKKPLPLWVRIGGVILMAISMFALLQRTNIFLAILWLVAMMVAERAPTGATRLPAGGVERVVRSRPLPARRKRLLLPLLGVGLILVIVFQGVGAFLGKTGQQALSTGAVSQPLEDSGLTSPFVYYTGGLVAFLSLTDSTNDAWPREVVVTTGWQVGDNNPQTWGAAGLSPLLKIVPVGREWDPALAPYMDVGVLTNVFTWYEPFYRDFRVPGVVLGMFFMGFIASLLYRKRFESTRIMWVQGALTATIFLSVFAARTNTALFWVGLFAILFLTSGPFAVDRGPSLSNGARIDRASAK